MGQAGWEGGLENLLSMKPASYVAGYPAISNNYFNHYRNFLAQTQLSQLPQTAEVVREIVLMSRKGFEALIKVLHATAKPHQEVAKIIGSEQLELTREHAVHDLAGFNRVVGVCDVGVQDGVEFPAPTFGQRV